MEAGKYTTIDNFKGGSHLETVPVTTPVQRHTYALRVHGDSMESTGRDSFPEGSVIVIEPELPPLPGDYVIARNAADQTTFKQLSRRGRVVSEAAQSALPRSDRWRRSHHRAWSANLSSASGRRNFMRNS